MREKLLEFLNGQLVGSLELLHQMVAINSYTLNRPGVNHVGQLTARSFVPLGFQAEFVPSIDAAYGDHLVLTRRGRAAGAIGLISHLDTVFTPEEETAHRFAWRKEGNRIYGPGTMDIKGGTVMIHLILSALQKLAPDVFEAVTWNVMLNSSEEVLSTDFGKLCLERMGNEAIAALVFEAGGKHQTDLALVTARKGRATFRLETEGRGAHAGSRHERGANAIAQMAELIQRVTALTDYQKKLTFNVGTVAGGTVVNRVPHQTTAEVEMRAFTAEAYRAGVKAMLALDGLSTVSSPEDKHPCRSKVTVTSEVPPWPTNAGTESLFAVWQQTAEQVQLRITQEHRGGISDGNFLWANVPTIDGLGPYGDNAHCSEQSADGTKEQEYVDVTSFVPRAALHVLAIQKLVMRAFLPADAKEGGRPGLPGVRE